MYLPMNVYEILLIHVKSHLPFLALEVIKNEHWESLRQVLSTAFKKAILKHQIPVFKEKMFVYTDVIRKSIEDDKPFEMVTSSVEYGLEVIMKFGLGFDNGRVLGDATKFLFQFWYQAVPWLSTFHYWKYIRTPDSKKMWKHTDTIEKLIDKMLKERLAHGITDEENDWLAVLIRAYKKNLITYEQMKCNTFQLVPAGDTTPAAISWLFYYLAKYKDIQSKLRQVIFDKLGNQKDYTYDDIQSIDYLDCVVRETLRISPPVRAPIPRTLKKDIKMGDYFLPKGSQVAYCAFTMHYNEKYWPNPTKFDPDRFLPEEKKKTS